jgi:hypothetical protein
MLLTREMLKNPIEVSVAAPLGFKQAQELARRQAGEICREPNLSHHYQITEKIPCQADGNL